MAAKFKPGLAAEHRRHVETGCDHSFEASSPSALNLHRVCAGTIDDQIFDGHPFDALANEVDGGLANVDEAIADDRYPSVNRRIERVEPESSYTDFPVRVEASSSDDEI
ncbi:hypothetical protein [Sphingosinicella sp. BN140058]|uniref:hypothetical protein n=1 Tax=Sphingosinicella sp. BN140058 TaxID=1892855 RepID=UPI00101225B5|nr:hypothetical protein [Sphingosinicella sp. BN140058]QAY78980.1 hypothetical protein ETR14_22405 [Sphingosinicella sp. BN140058]